MMAILYQTVAYGVITLLLLPLDSGQFGIGHPTNITENAGKTNVFIPCPFGGPAAVTWGIGDHYYSQSTLPEQYTSVPGGLIIGVIQPNMSGLSFQCLTPSSNGLYDTESRKGILTVLGTQFEESYSDGFTYTPFHSEPTNFTQYVDDQNVFIPCPFGGPAVQTWKIGDQYYTSSTLPKNYHPTIGGLIISSIQSTNMSGLTFQCFSPNGTGLYVDESSVGTLTVKNPHNYDDNNLPNELPDQYGTSNPRTQLILDHQNFWFTNSTVTFAWKIIGPQCDLNTVYFINSTECILPHVEHTDINRQYYGMAVTGNKANIPTQYLIDRNKKLMYFGISVGSIPNGTNVCGNLKLFNKITVKEEVSTETHSATPYKSFCITVPSASTSKGAVRIVLPYRSTSVPKGPDLICLAECTKATGCSLDNKCTPALRETIFSGAVTLSKKNNATNMFQLCFSNPTIEMNGTKVHIYYDRSCTNSFNRETIATAEYVKAIILNITVPPPPPNITVDSAGKICIAPQLNESFPVEYYKIVITDVTGYEIFKNESVTTTCTTVDSLLQHECAPFNISVVAHNVYGDSSPTVYQADAGFNLTSWCDCANMKVNLTLDHVPQTRSVKYNYKCSFFNGSFDTDLESAMTFVVKLQGNGYEQDKEIKLCSTEMETGMFSGLDCGSTYNISAYFAYPNGNSSDCPVANTKNNITTSNSIKDLSCPNNFLIVLIPLLVLTLGVVILVIICLYYCWKRQWCCRRQANGEDPNADIKEKYEKIN